MTPDQLARFNAHIAGLTDLRNEFVAEEVLPPIEPPVPPEPEPKPPVDIEGDLPQEIRGGAGTRGTLRALDSSDDIARYNLKGSFNDSTKMWSLPECKQVIQDLDVKGMIYYQGSDPLKLQNVRTQGVQYSKENPSNGGEFDYVTIVAKVGHPLGQGGINFWGQRDWRAAHCNFSGFADGMQVSNTGLIEDSWFHDFAFGATTHNDGIQLYGGKVTVRDCVFDMGQDPRIMEGHSNGALFVSVVGAQFEATNLYVYTLHNSSKVNALNGVRGLIQVNSGLISGGALPGNVVLKPGVIRIP